MNLQRLSEAVFKKWGHLKGLEGFIDNKLFYITGGQLSPLFSDQSTKYVSLIQNEIFAPNEVNFAAYSEPYLIVSSSTHRSEDFDAPIFYSANTETGEVKELAAIKELGDNSNLSFNAQTDKAFFVIYYQQETDQEMFALVGKENLWESNSTWKKFSFDEQDTS